MSLSTVRDFEKGRHTPIAATLAAMRKAIEDAGVKLLFSNSGKAIGILCGDAGKSP